MPAPTRILIANHWHDDNRGDSAITQGVLTLIDKVLPNAAITVTTLTEQGPLAAGESRHVQRMQPSIDVRSSPSPTELRGQSHERTMPAIASDAARWWLRSAPDLARGAVGLAPRAWRDLVADHDLVILNGGSDVFDDARVPAVLSLPRLAQVLAPVRAAASLRRRSVMLGHTLGPFDRAAGRRIAGSAISAADLIVVREAPSVDLARSLGARDVQQAPDMAFALEPVSSVAVRHAICSLAANPARTIAMSVRQHPTDTNDLNGRVIDAFAAAARSLVDAGFIDAVVVVPHTTGPTPIEDDRGISNRLAEALRRRDVPLTLMTTDLGPTELSAFYGALAAVVAVRLHAAILALNAGTPTFAVSYFTGKTQGVMTQVGLPDAVGDFETITADALLTGIRALLSRPGLRDQLSDSAVVRRQHLIDAAQGWLAPTTVTRARSMLRQNVRA